MLDGQRCVIDFCGETCEGAFADGRLLWADGDVWVRAPAGEPETPNPVRAPALEPETANPAHAPTIQPRKDYDRAIAARIQEQCGGELKVAAARPHLHQVGPSFDWAVVPESREDRIAMGKELLHRRCAALGMRQVEMSDDGNCQFRALSQELFGTQQFHTLVRAEVSSYLSRREDSYRQFFPTGEWEKYLSDMGNLRTWGDELTLRAAADAFKVRIHLITSSDQMWYLVYDPVEGVSERELFITYVAPIHYNTMEPIA